jgi:hypothetical protein
MYARHPLSSRLLLASCAAFATALTACGGYGGGNYTAPGGGTVTCGSGYSVACPAPTVTLTAPAANATVSGTVTLTATASASSTYNLTITSVAFMVDGTSVGTAMTSPYTFMWDSTKVANGSHSLTAVVTDNGSSNSTATSTAVMVTVSNGAAAAAMGPEQIFPAVSSKASGTARFELADSASLSGTVELSGMSANAVTIHQGFAGSTGEAVLELTPSATHAGVWSVPANTTLSAAQLATLAQGGLYVVATSAAHPQGEIRGQLVPGGVEVSFSELGMTPESSRMGLPASGVAAATLDLAGGTLTVHVNSAGIEDATGAQVAGATGTALADLTRDASDMSHFSGQLTHLRAAQIADFEAGRLSVSVAAASVPEGAIRGAIGPESPARGD